MLLTRLGRLRNVARSRSRCSGLRCCGQHRLMRGQSWGGILRLKGSGDHSRRGRLRADRVGRQTGNRGGGGNHRFEIALRSQLQRKLRRNRMCLDNLGQRYRRWGKRRRCCRCCRSRHRVDQPRSAARREVRHIERGNLQLEAVKHGLLDSRHRWCVRFARLRGDRRGCASGGLHFVQVEVEFAGFWRERIRRYLRVQRL